LKKIIPVEECELKNLSRLYRQTLKQARRYKLIFKDQLNIIFPELEKKSKFYQTKAIPNMLLKFPTPKEIYEANPEEVREALIEKLKSPQKFTLEYVKKLKSLAKESIGIEDYPANYFQHTIKIMLFYQDLLEELKDNMVESLEKTPYHKLLGERGYSKACLPLIVAEVGDIRRFSSYKKFVKYCGLDISEQTSGTSVNKKSRITKRGSRVLRSTFYMMGLLHLRFKRTPFEIYERLCNKGKNKILCLTALARKIGIKVYFYMMKCHES
jgi:transposase